MLPDALLPSDHGVQPQQGGTIDSWGTVNGKWTNAADWSTGVPTSTSAVVLSSAAAETVTFGGNDTVYSLLSTTDTLNMASGSLTISNGATFGALLTMSNTTLALDAASSMSGGVTLGSGGTLSLASGVADTVSGVLSIDQGLLVGPGTLDTGGATTIADAGTSFYIGQGAGWTNTGTVTDSGRIDLGIPVGKTADTSTLTITNAAGGVFNLASSDAGLVFTTPAVPPTATLINAGLLEDTATSGTTQIAAALVNSGTITLSSGVLELIGSLTNTGSIAIGTSTLEALGGGALGSLTGAGGTLDLAGGSFTDTIAALSAVSSLQIGATLGIVGGGGALASAVALLGGGTLGLAATGATGVNGLNADGGAVSGPGTLTTSGTTTIAALATGMALGNGANWVNAGTVNDAGLIDLGLGIGGAPDISTVALSNMAGAVFDFTTAGSGFGFGSVGVGFSASFTNSGLLEDTAPGLVVVQPAMTNAGTISLAGSLAGGTLDLAGGLNNTGVVQIGSATLQIYGGGTLGVLSAATGTLDLAGGSFSGGNSMLSRVSTLQIGGTLGLAGTAGTLTNTVELLQGELTLAAGTRTSLAAAFIDNGGSLSGAGTLATLGATTIAYGYGGLFIGNGATWTNNGTVTAADYVNLGLFNNGSFDSSTVTLNNAVGAVYDITSNAAIHRFYATASFQAIYNNAGLLEKTGGVGTSNMNIAIDNTGTITVTSGTLEFSGGGTIAGVTSGSGTLDLGLTSFSAAITNLAGVANLEIGGGTLDLSAASGSFSNTVAINNGGTLVLANGQTVTFGAALVDNGGTIAGPGTIVTAGTTAILFGSGGMGLGNGATWNNTGTILAGDSLDFGGIYAGTPDSSTVTLNNQVGGVYDFTNDVGIGLGSTATGFNPIFTNAGLLEKTAGGNISNIALFINTTGTITASSGILQLGGGGLLGGVIGATGAAGAVVLSGAGTFNASGLTIADNGANVALAIASGATLVNIGTSTLDGIVAVGNNSTGVAQFLNAAGATLLLGDADAAIVNDGSFAFSNAGLIRDTFAGTLALSDRLANIGTIDVANGVLQLANVTGSGGLLIEAGATLEIVTNVYTTQAYGFNGPGATLKQDTPASIKSAIGNFGAGDRIDLVGSVASSATTKGNTLTVVTNTGTYLYAGANPVGSFDTGIASDGAGGSIVTMYRDAAAQLSPQPVTFGNLHIGAAGTAALVVSNTAAADGYSESLDAQVATTSAGIGSFGSVSLLAAGSFSNAISFTTSAASAGAIEGFGTIALESDGTGIDSAGTTVLAPQTVTFSGGVYRYAAPSTVAPVNFGVVHVGDTVAQALSLSNLDPADGYSEALDAFLVATGAITGSGSISMLAAGATDSTSLLLGLATLQSGVIGGNATLDLISDGVGIDGLGTTALANQLIGVTGTIDNYATAAFVDAGGPVITAGASAGTYVLNLGTAMMGGAALSVVLGAENSATGLADLLGGTLFTTGGAGFTDSGFGTFSGLGAGQSELGQSITLATGTVGVFTETVTLTASGSNSSGYSGSLATEVLTITGDIISPNTTYDLTSAGTTIVGAPGIDIFVATGGVLNSKDSLTGSNSGQNVLQLSGGGTFDVSAPSVFANIQTIAASEGQAGTAKLPNTIQTVDLRPGTSETVNVANGVPAQGDTKKETITIYGAANNDVINLASGSDIVYLGGNGETVNGGTGTDTIYATTASIGAKVTGGTGGSTLDLTGGGTFTLGANIASIASLTLSAATTAYKVTANNLAKLAITGSGAADTIKLGAASQTVNANGGAVHVEATAKFASAAITGAAGAELEITTAGTVTLNKNDTSLTVLLDAASSLTLNKAAFIGATGATAGSTITAAGTQQTLSSIAGGDFLVGYGKFGDTFSGSSAGLNGDSITNFGGNDVIDATDLIFGSLQDSYSGNASQGTLTLSDGTHNLSITMVGSYTLASFHFASDGHSGTDVTFI